MVANYLYMPDNKTFRPYYVYTLLTIMSLAYAGFHVLTSLAMTDASVVTPLFAFMRIAGSIPVYLIVAYTGGYTLRTTRQDLLDLGWLGLLGVTCNQVCILHVMVTSGVCNYLVNMSLGSSFWVFISRRQSMQLLCNQVSQCSQHS